MKKIVFILSLLFIFFSCQKTSKHLFKLRYDTQIEFLNQLEYTQDFNPYTYRNFYNGAGVALGDINNDGLLDVYFTGNLVDNKLFLNKGNWQFQDITLQAGVACAGVWSTGATFADINGDGLLDLYVCKSGKPGGDNRHNELFINQGDLTFKEESKTYGLDVLGLSVHAAFFDADLDGDLDCYVLNNSLRSVGGYDLIKDQRDLPDPNGEGNKFFENQAGRFVDVSQEKGIYTSAIGFGLGITLSDFNNDRYPDLYISNDFFERDYFYLNKGNGFQESLEKYFHSTAMGAMGADAADVNNDLLADLFVTEMLPATLQRQKTKAKFDSWDKYALMVKNGYGTQFPRNAMQRNMGKEGFLELSRLSGVAATEWSWASLIFDMDNDSYNDIFVANGIYKDLLDRDYLSYMANEAQVQNILKDKENAIKNLIDIMPSKAVPNCAFQNKGDFIFVEKAASWGLGTPSFSNGNAYGDLDNDGDLDLVVNNVNMNSFIYENTTDTLNQRSFSVGLKSKSKNSFAVGAKAIIYYGANKKQMREQFPSRGFQSSIANRLHFGVGKIRTIDSLMVLWPNGAISRYDQLTTNQTHLFWEPEKGKILPKPTSLETKPTDKLDFVHQENNWIDFNRERLIPQMYHNEGPAIATADLNADGIDDIFVGGAKNQTATLLLSEGSSYQKITNPFQNDKGSEDVVAEFFDGDGDGDLDLFVGSGGRAFSRFSALLDDRYYENIGEKHFVKKSSSLPFDSHFSTGGVTIGDFNKDGFKDIIIGERFDLSVYGKKGNLHLLINDGLGNFILNQQLSFEKVGLITHLSSVDFNKDGWLDLVAVGEWMPISIWINESGTFVNRTKEYGLESTTGLWNSLFVEDFNLDGRPDLIAGNMGINTFFSPGTKLFLNDFDKNGSFEPIITFQNDGKDYPIADKDELIAQLPYLKKRALKYENYAAASMPDLFAEAQLSDSEVTELQTLETTLFVGKNSGFEKIELPLEIQYAPVFAIDHLAAEKRGKGSLFFGGNQFLVKPQFGQYDASHGWQLDYQNESSKWQWEQPKSLAVKGQIRQLEVVNLESQKKLLIGLNNSVLNLIKLEP